MPTLLVPARAEGDELLDGDGHSPEARGRSLGDIRTFNRLFGGLGALRRSLRPWIQPDTSRTLLDVGTGSGDLPVSLKRWAESRRCLVRPTGLDLLPENLAEARRREGAVLRLVAGRADRLPFADRSFDLVVSSLTLHHFDDALAVAAMREMARVARVAVVVNDLQRNVVAAGLAWTVTRAFRMHPITRYDAPMSVLRARTPAEYRALAAAAGWNRARVRRFPFWRVAVTHEVAA